MDKQPVIVKANEAIFNNLSTLKLSLSKASKIMMPLVQNDMEVLEEDLQKVSNEIKAHLEKVDEVCANYKLAVKEEWSAVLDWIEKCNTPAE